VCWLVFLPIGLFALLALAGVAVAVLLERGERARRLRNPIRVRNGFRPVLIQGGKAQAPPGARDRESRIA
jgi:hypothetical protein